MSIEIVLVPLAIAAVGAVRAALVEDAPYREVQVASRLRDGALVAQALGDLGAVVGSADHDRIEAVHDGRASAWTRTDAGLWVARFDASWDESAALALLAELDAAYGLRVQQEVLRKIRERAPGAGMSVASETVGDDDTVTLVLDVGSGR